jgi:hypothetical protein
VYKRQHGDERKGGTTGSGATFIDSGNTGHTVTENGNAIAENGGTFNDSGSTTHVVTEVGNAYRERESEYKFATDGVGYKLDGAGDWLSTPDHANWDIAAQSSDYTVEFFFKFIENATLQTFLSQTETVAGDDGWRIQHASNNAGLLYKLRSGGATIVDIDTTDRIQDFTWHHFALTIETTGDHTIYLDGVEIHAINDTSTDTFSADLLIGNMHASSSDYVHSYMDEIRISDTNRYPTAFTPTTTQFSDDGNTLLLIHCGETKSGTTGSGATFTDTSGVHTITEVGNAIEATGNLYKF